ncbi:MULTISPECIES: hypothetical protein [Pectobacterium]|uniref:hypothetical protein n=1 Tax=Pectobacterium TaxID=122277 RepID=UPI001B38C447|nr:MULTISPECIES: hypothetical protein [Pectobacterium]MBQ4791942.1 hypothetical protein [Pectobacterium versatile]MCA6962174.1 hypothetical protein [Pectobacterium odoriferum]MCH5010273.1 hypothetical protein [Pectobacterium odoriferum]
MKYFLWIIIALLTPISIFALGVIYNSFRLSQFEWGSVSDWVSSTANAFMAAAALYAAWNAKGWFTQRVKEDGYKAAYAFINHDIPDIYNSLQISKGMLSLNTKTFYDLDNLMSKHFDFTRDYEIMLKIINARENIKRNTSIFSRHGFSLKSERKAIYDGFIISIDNAIIYNQVAWQMLNPQNPFPIQDDKNYTIIFDTISKSFDTIDYYYKNILSPNDKFSDVFNIP